MSSGKLIISTALVALAASAWLLLSLSAEQSAPTKPPAQPGVWRHSQPEAQAKRPSPAPHRRSLRAAANDRSPDAADNSDTPGRSRSDIGEQVDLTTYHRPTWIAAAEARYQQEDYEGVLELGNQLLAEVPNDALVLRLVVLSACAVGDAELAQEHVSRLIPVTRSQVQEQCRNAGVELIGGPRSTERSRQIAPVER